LTGGEGAGREIVGLQQKMLLCSPIVATVVLTGLSIDKPSIAHSDTFSSHRSNVKNATKQFFRE
jgi:hypothetical protein